MKRALRNLQFAVGLAVILLLLNMIHTLEHTKLFVSISICILTATTFLVVRAAYFLVYAWVHRPHEARRKTRWVKWVLGVFLLGSVGGSIGGMVIDNQVRRSLLFQTAISQFQQSAAANDLLGTPLQVSKGLFEVSEVGSHGNEHMDIVIPVSGSRASGALYISGSQHGDTFTIVRLQLKAESIGVDKDLLDAPMK